MQLKEAMQGYIMDGQIARHSRASLTLKQQRLGYFIEWCEAQEITEVAAVRVNTVRAFLVHLHETKARNVRVAAPKSLAPETISGYLRVVRAFFHWCEKEDLIQKGQEPTARVPHIKIPEDIIPSFSADQMDAMLRQCDRTTERGYRDYTILLVLMDTGIRARELVGLTIADVYEDHLVIRGKGEKTREVGLGPTAAKSLWKYLHQYRKAVSEHVQHVFLGRGGRRLTYAGLYQIVKVVGQRAEIEHVDLHPHTFRHTFAFSWLANGGDVFKLSRVMGHSNIQTTQIYLRAFQSRDARVDHAQFSPVERLKLGRHAAKREAK